MRIKSDNIDLQSGIEMGEINSMCCPKSEFLHTFLFLKKDFIYLFLERRERKEKERERNINVRLPLTGLLPPCLGLFPGTLFFLLLWQMVFFFLISVSAVSLLVCKNAFDFLIFTLYPTVLPSVNEWIKKLWYIYSMEYYTAERKKEPLPFVTAWMELETIMLSEISQAVKDKYHMNSAIHRT